MANRAVLQVFETYQKARVNFVQTVAELANRPENIEALQHAGAMALLRPLLLDNVPSIQQSAAMALGRLASFSEELAEAVVSGEILPQLVYSLSEQNRFYKKAAAYVLRAVAKHSPPLAQAVVDCGALDSLVACLEEFDPGVKESAAWALGYVARHTPELAQSVVDAGAVPLLVLCVQEPELSLKRIAASTLSDICKHSPELAQSVVDAGAIAYIAPLIQSPDAKLKRQVCSCLAQIAKHSFELAELVVEGEIFPKIFNLLKDLDEVVRKNAATTIREIAKHTPELAQLVVTSGALGVIVDYVSETKGNNRLPGIMTLGYIAAFSDSLAQNVIASGGVVPLARALDSEKEDHLRAAAAWSLGQIGRHSSEHSKAVTDAEVLPLLLDAFLDNQSSDDLKTKAKRALKTIVQKCLHLPALQPLLSKAPVNILTHVTAQYAKVLPGDRTARRAFVSDGGLEMLQRIAEHAPEGSELQKNIQTINACYPDEIVRYYSPGFSKNFDKLIDDHVPPME